MSGQVEIRRARAEEVPAIVALLADDALGRTRETPGDPRYDAAFRAIDADPNQLLAVLVAEGDVAGTLQLTFIPGLSHLGAWRGEIEGVRIASALRGTGLGARLLEWAVEQCRARGCRLVQLTTNNARTDAQRFYARLGFQPSHVGFKRTL